MNKRYEVKITLKKSVLDPQGQVILEALHSLGFTQVTDVRMGKSVDLTMESGSDDPERIRSMCEKLLANTVIEEYRVRPAE